ncbi:MAG: hypothetical protein IPJ68_00055 [Candidatus Moraniibacteriota bacterium]|nr:MAG: hypothetical protein IPJ68_00055 [Candidatus Moranbacteria bacterium]
MSTLKTYTACLNNCRDAGPPFLSTTIGSSTTGTFAVFVGIREPIRGKICFIPDALIIPHSVHEYLAHQYRAENLAGVIRGSILEETNFGGQVHIPDGVSESMFVRGMRDLADLLLKNLLNLVRGHATEISRTFTELEAKARR